MLNMQTLPIDQLIPAPYNPRVTLKPGSPEYTRLERSLKEFDLVQPIVWNEKTGHVVGGHQRLTILKNWQQKEVDVVVVSLSLEREKSLNVALNNQQVGGNWDPIKLSDLLTDLQTNATIDATLTGYDEQEIQDLLFTPAHTPEENQPLEEDAKVRVTLEIEQENWEAVRSDLDTLIGQHTLAVHIKFP